MSTQILTTKLYIPPPRLQNVHRPRLTEKLNDAVHRKLTVISAPAGFGKTTLVSEWVHGCDRAVAWLSLDEADHDPLRFWVYFIAALQTIEPVIGQGALRTLQSGQAPPIESILTGLLNEIAAIPYDFVLVLDDYHAVDSLSVDNALSFLLQYLPPQAHLVITTREDPNLPLTRMRARGQLTELRITDLRFTSAETDEFINQVMNFPLSEEDITALESRTEGWIAGLQLAAISMQGLKDTKDFIQSFTGSHHFVMDYLVEEVFQQQAETVQTFLLCTSILDRLCGPLCEAVLADTPVSGQETLEYLEKANLFLIPLDNERQWYRYHHLFADLLRQRLLKEVHRSANSSSKEKLCELSNLHVRASVWYEENGLDVSAFHHATAAQDIDRAERLIAGDGMPLHYRGAMVPVLNWLESLPAEEMDSRPSLWVTYASVLTMVGKQPAVIEDILQSAEASLQETRSDNQTQDLYGQIAAIRAMLAIPLNQVETLITQSRRALKLLHPDNLPVRTNASWTLGFAYQLQGDRDAAIQAYTETISISQASGNTMMTIAATTCLGQVQESVNRYKKAAETFQRVLQLAGNPPLPAACEAHLGLAKIHYQWNDLEAAQQHGEQSLQLALQLENVDTPAASWVILSRIQLAQGDVFEAAALLSKAEEFLRNHHSAHRMPEVAAAQVLVLLRQGDPDAAAGLARAHDLPLSQARVFLSRGDSSQALALLERLYREAAAKDRQDERLDVLVLLPLALHAHGDEERALQVLGEALTLARPGKFIRIFVDEGPPMARLLQKVEGQGAADNYIWQIQAAFGNVEYASPVTQQMIDPLTDRELDVLRLLGTYMNGPEIAGELLVSLNTMRTHTKKIYNKLGVNNRQAAVRRAKELDLL